MAAPIIIFAYKRKKHLETLINSLLSDELSQQSNIYIFCDGYKSEIDREQVEETQKYICSLVASKVFRYLHIYLSEKNNGLANSIIRGVTQLMDEYESAIIIEDDVILADRFLEYMNGALKYYQNDRKIWSVGGFSFIKHFPEGYDSDVFFTQRSSSYAWATWADRWDKVDWQVKDYPEFRRSLKKRVSFDKWGQDRSMMLDAQRAGKTASWAIRFDYAMWKNGMYNVVPRHSRCSTTGHDGSGTNSPNETNDIFALVPRKLDKPIAYSAFLIDDSIRRQFAEYFKVSFLRRIKRFCQYNIFSRS